MTNATLELITVSRQSMLDAIEGLSVEQLNTTPAGFSNNLIWNIGHVVGVQQAYLYGKNNIASTVDPQLITDYANGTYPKASVSQQEIDTIKELALSTVADLENDIAEGVFEAYQASTVTPKKINLATMQDALNFILFHEALHLGAVRCLKRMIAGETAQAKAA